MICPKCASPTKVYDSRPNEAGTITTRKRECVECRHRLVTQESTFDVAAHRERDAKRSAKRRVLKGDHRREWDRAHKRARKAHSAAQAEAAETGRPLDEILQAWGLAA